MAIFLALLEVLLHNWEGVLAIGAFATMLAKGKIDEIGLKAATEATKTIATDFALKEFSNQEKREMAVEALHQKLPLWARPFVTKQKAELLVETAYQFLVKSKLEDKK